MYGAPYNLLASFLGVRPDRLRGIVARWRSAGYVQTGRLGPGPAWCWLTRSGLAVTGQRFASARPALGRLAHIRAVLADLLAEAASPAPRFAVVICEDIERSGRDTYYALQLEKQLTLAGIPLFATDEPIDVTGANATTVLVREVKQGVAEWFRLQIKEKAWRGLPEHSLAGWNIGTRPMGTWPTGYRTRSPTRPPRAAPKTRLILDPGRAPVVAVIFEWRTAGKLGGYAITQRLNARPDLYPSPGADGGPRPPSTPSCATPNTPATWSSAGDAPPPPADRSRSPKTSGYGHPSPPTPPSSPAPPSTPPKPSEPSTPPAATPT